MNQGPLVGSTVFHGTLVAVVVCACPGVSSAECLPTLSNRCLIINASDIIIAQPVDPEPFRGKSRHAFAIQVRNGTRVDQGERFRVVGVLRGSAAKRGEVVRVTGIYFYHLRNAWSVSEAERENEGDAVKQVILFLRQARNPDPKNKAFELSLSGIRCLTEDGEVLYPVQFINPGDYYLVALDGPDWDELIANVKAEIPKVAQRWP